MTTVILCHPGDVAALWLDRALRTSGGNDVELVSVEQLVFSTKIVHHMDGAGDRGAIHLADGRVLRPEAIAGLVNRVQHLPTQHFDAAAPADREYAIAELYAFMLAWLNGVAGPVLNPAQPSALGGGNFAEATILQAASVAGLPTREWRAASNDASASSQLPVPPATHTAIVFQWRLFGSLLPAGLQDGCRRLAALLGVPLLQVLLNRSAEGGWRFVGASGMVDFRLGGAPLAAAIARAFTLGSAS